MEKIPTKIKRIIDQAGELDEQIKELERQKKALVEKLSDYQGYLEGRDYSVDISDYKRDVIVAEKVRALQAELEQCINQENKEWLIQEIETELDDLLYIQACDERQAENNIWR